MFIKTQKIFLSGPNIFSFRRRSRRDAGGGGVRTPRPTLFWRGGSQASRDMDLETAMDTDLDGQDMPQTSQPDQRHPTRNRTKTKLYQSGEEEAREREQRRGREKAACAPDVATDDIEEEGHDWKQGERMGEAKNPGPGNIFRELPYPCGRVSRRRQERREPGPAGKGWRTPPAMPPHRKGNFYAMKTTIIGGGCRTHGTPTGLAPMHLHQHANIGPAVYDGARLTPRRDQFGTNHNTQLQQLQLQVDSLQRVINGAQGWRGSGGRGKPPTYAAMVRQPPVHENHHVRPQNGPTTHHYATEHRFVKGSGGSRGKQQFWRARTTRAKDSNFGLHESFGWDEHFWEPNQFLKGKGKGWGGRGKPK